MGRRLCIFGFCRSIEMLSDVVEDTVVEHGGEVCCQITFLSLFNSLLVLNHFLCAQIYDNKVH